MHCIAFDWIGLHCIGTVWSQRNAGRTPNSSPCVATHPTVSPKAIAGIGCSLQPAGYRLQVASYELLGSPSCWFNERACSVVGCERDQMMIRDELQAQASREKMALRASERPTFSSCRAAYLTERANVSIIDSMALFLSLTVLQALRLRFHRFIASNSGASMGSTEAVKHEN